MNIELTPSEVRLLRESVRRDISSLSIGGRGFTENLGPRGHRVTVGLPGPGLSYASHLDPGHVIGCRPLATPILLLLGFMIFVLVVKPDNSGQYFSR
jgi:hypothetical protein